MQPASKLLSLVLLILMGTEFTQVGFLFFILFILLHLFFCIMKKKLYIFICHFYYFFLKTAVNWLHGYTESLHTVYRTLGVP